jgi:hypothetical protein
VAQRVTDFLWILQSALELPMVVLYALVVAEAAVIGLALFLVVRYWKFVGYMLRNTRRNLIRSFLTVASIAISLFLMMTLFSLLAMVGDAATKVRDSNRIVTLSSQGFTQPVPVSVLNQVRTMPGIVAASSLSWYGG